tara:strand:+ start:107 stop:970 length:864 start_codon:yes stop_codon:yes gene_type:complete
MTNATLAILMLWRDSESYISRSLGQLHEMEHFLKRKNIDCVYVFYENDSEDGTATYLTEWMKESTGVVISQQLNAPKWGSVPSLERVRYQAKYRNTALDFLQRYYSYDYLLVADSDVYWSPKLISKMIKRLNKHSSWGMISPNTVQNVPDYVGNTNLPSYFDSWSLKDVNDNQGLTFAANPFLLETDRENWEKKKPVACNSAFGSIAMIKAEAMKPNPVYWDVLDGVEHWIFCEKIRNNNYKIIADPTLHAEIKHNKKIIVSQEMLEHQKSRWHSIFLEQFLPSFHD